jgi:HAE1 family hydrophobic/amphiphilic exporter-1
MKFIDFSVTRRVSISMVYALIFILGWICWQRLPQEFMPSLEFPQLMVMTSYENASSQEVETLITKVIEEACGTVKGVRRIHSVSKEGISIVTVEFQWGVDMNFASLNLREKVDLVKTKLPREAEEPRIEKFNPFALPVMVLSLSGNRPPQELLKIAKRPVAELLEKVNGVAAVSVTGGLEREIQVELDQSKLAHHQVPILQAAEALSRSNITYPAGTIKDNVYEYVVRVMGAFLVPREIEDVVVKVDRDRVLPSALSSRMPASNHRSKEGERRDTNQPQVLMGSLGTVKDGLKERSSYARYDGRENVSLAILKQGDAHIVEVAEAAKHKLEDIQKKLPQGISLKVVYDQSIFIKAGLRKMFQESLLGAVLAFIVLLLFLGNSRDALLVSASIPTSVFATFIFMNMQGITLNTISMTGLAVGIGLIVDAAIVVVENITRHKEAGKTAIEAAIIGTKEMMGAVTSSSATVVVVFLPLVFVLGIIGQVFRDLSWAIVYTHLAAWVVAFTLIPMLAGWLYHKASKRPAWSAPLMKNAGKLNVHYTRILRWSLDHPGKLLTYTTIAWVVSVAFLFFIPKTLFPKIDQGQFLMQIALPVGTRLDITNQTVQQIEDVLQKVPEVEHRMVTVGSIAQEGLQPMGVNEAQIVVDLKDRRKRSSDGVIQVIKNKMEGMNLGGAKVVFREAGGAFAGFGGDGSPIVVEIKGYDLNVLQKVSQRVINELQEVSGVYNTATSLNLNSPEVGIDVDRERAAAYSLSISDLAKTLSTAVQGKVVSKFREEGKEIDIRLRLAEADRNDIKSLHGLLIHSPLELDIPLEAVAAIKPRMGPAEILHYDQQRTVLVTAGLFKKSIDEIKPKLDKILEKIRHDFPDNTFDLTGEAAQVADSFNSLKQILILSLLLVYMIMAAQFESLWKPFLIMLTIPLALIGLGPVLILTGHSLSAMAGMGMVLLCGIVVNNGIVLIDFVNHREGTKPLKEVLIDACHVRTRPILMTAATNILGMLPIALGLGREAKMQAPMAVVICFGLFISTMLTLVFLPTLYLVFTEKIIKKKPVV